MNWVVLVVGGALKAYAMANRGGLAVLLLIIFLHKIHSVFVIFLLFDRELVCVGGRVDGSCEVSFRILFLFITLIDWFIGCKENFR